MPSAKPNAPEEGFRRQAWGFNRDDVLAYVNALASEAQQQQLEYEEQVKQLQAQVDKLKKEQLNARACVEKLQMTCSSRPTAPHRPSKTWPRARKNWPTARNS